jgi:UDP-glucose 4-epimerase
MTQHGCVALNLGTGCGYSVLELIRTFERATGAQMPYRVVERRPGDVAELWADVSMAREVLGWQARHGLERMCEDAWRWQLNNPDGYQVA